MKLKITILAVFALLSFKLSHGQCDDALFEERNGIAVVEIESGNITSSWREETGRSGFTGDSFVAWRGSNSFNTPGNALIEYKVKINNPGTYRFQWRNNIGIGSNNTEHNDSWLRFPDADDFFAQRGNSIIFPRGSGKTPNPNGASSSGWFKVYGNTLNWNWTSNTSDHDPHFIYAKFNSPGIYTIEVSARSNGHFIDRMVLYNEDLFSQANATQFSREETLCNGSSTPPVPDPVVEPEIATVELIDGDSNQLISVLNNSIEINIANTTSNLGVNAIPLDDTVTSINFELEGPGTTVTRIENIAPYSLFGGLGDTIEGRDFEVGEYVLKITPYSERNASGNAGSTITIDLTIIEENEPNIDLSIESLQYVNTDTQQILGTLNSGTEINLTTIDNADIGIIASVSSIADVSSIQFSLNGPRTVNRIENIAPYSLFGDRNNILSGSELPVGNYQLDVTAYAERNASGSKGETISVSFSVVESASSLVLVNSISNTDIQILNNGSQISQSDAQNMNIRLATSISNIGSVGFELSGSSSENAVEHIAPYAIFGDEIGDFRNGELSSGNYSLTVTLYSSRNLKGTILDATTVNFTVSSANNSAVTSKLYPNPVVGSSFNIDFTNMESNTEVNYSIVNSSGLQISSGSINTNELDTITIPVSSSMTPGLYYVITYSQGVKETIPFIKN